MSQVVGLVLFDPEVETSLAQWVMEDVVAQGMRDKVHFSLRAPAVPTSDSQAAEKEEEGAAASSSSSVFLSAAHTAILGHVAARQHAASSLVFLVIAVFWDGQSERSKGDFARLRELADGASDAKKSLMADISGGAPALPVTVEVLVQALNAKKGEHNMHENRSALVQSLAKKLNASQQLATHGTAPFSSTSTASTARAVDATAMQASLEIGEADISPAAITAAVENGQGECFFLVSAPSRALLDARVAELWENCAAVNVGVCPVMLEPREVRPKAATAPLTVQEFLLRRSQQGRHLEMRLAMCGNVDSGKSTLTSVLTRGGRDDGRGAARAFVFNHRHEAATGRTSSISENHLGFSGTGEVVNYQLGAMRGGAGSSAAAAPSAGGEEGQSAVSAVTRQFTPQELASRSAKVFTLYDLAGHERYLKTTVLGMTRNMPDYACIVISANNGIQRMTKEHLALCLALKLPFFIAVTRIDATPENIHKETMANINKLLKIPTVRKLPYPVTKPDELILAAKNLRKNAITPIFEVSNVTGYGLPRLLQFINLLPARKDWHEARAQPREMVIDSTFFVTGVGTVVGGIVTQGVFRVNDTVLLGPDGFGHYRPVSIKSIHVKGVDCGEVEAGSDAAFCLKKEKRSAIRKGNILADPLHPPQAFWQFEAEITILYHSTTITIDYEPVIHSTTVRQSARMTYVEQETLRTGDKSIVRFHFLYRPEFMKENQRLIFREGRTKGIGVVTKLIPVADEQLLARSKVRKTMLRHGAVAETEAAVTAAAAVGKEGGKRK